jgi:hypothetical protein
VPAAIRRLPAFTIHAVYVVPPRRHSLVTIEAVRRFWAGGLGRIHLQWRDARTRSVLGCTTAMPSALRRQ